MKELSSHVPVPKAGEFMNDHVLAFGPATEIEHAVTRLLRRGYSGAPVVDDDATVIGVLSEVDCLRVLHQASHAGWPNDAVKDHMSAEPDTIGPELGLMEVASMFETGKHRRLPVVDGDRRLLGLITRQDVLRALEDHRRRQEAARLANVTARAEHASGAAE